jgi:hypothetical protein
MPANACAAYKDFPADRREAAAHANRWVCLHVHVEELRLDSPWRRIRAVVDRSATAHLCGLVFGIAYRFNRAGRPGALLKAPAMTQWSLSKRGKCSHTYLLHALHYLCWPRALSCSNTVLWIHRAAI